MLMPLATAELHVLRLVQLCQSMGCRCWPDTDYVCLRWHIALPVAVGGSNLRLWQKTQKLVVEARSVCIAQDGDKWATNGNGLKGVTTQVLLRSVRPCTSYNSFMFLSFGSFP